MPLDDPHDELDRILDLVHRTRTAQKRYFRERSPVNLHAAKDLERVLDFEVERWMERRLGEARPRLL